MVQNDHAACECSAQCAHAWAHRVKTDRAELATPTVHAADFGGGGAVAFTVVVVCKRFHMCESTLKTHMCESILKTQA